jgi:hypothetical protein
MASRILEFFGYGSDDTSSAAVAARRKLECPFLGSECIKTLNDRAPSGVCTLVSKKDVNVICCPIRLYDNSYQVLRDVAVLGFGKAVDLYPGRDAKSMPVVPGRSRIAVFGKRWGGELALPNRTTSGSYYVDWILARLDELGNLEDFLAVEVQSIDTTGNYRDHRQSLIDETEFSGWATAGFNWENVSKRILPQLIYKGNVLQRERLCTKGLFFVSPKPVYEKIQERLGGTMLSYHLQTGSVTFLWYDVGNAVPPGNIRPLVHMGTFTTNVTQIATAFTSPTNLPEPNVYEEAILRVL